MSSSSTSQQHHKTENFLLDIEYSKLDEDSFRQDLLLAERPAVLRGAASLHQKQQTTSSSPSSNPFLRCLPLFSSFEAIENVALGPNYDLAAAGAPEVASNAFMSCDRKMYRDIPADTVKEGLRVVKTASSSQQQQQQQEQDLNASFYMKLPLVSCTKILKELRLEEFLLKPEHQVTWCEHPMLLSPGNCFAWLYIGQRGSTSPSHVDVMGSDAVLACFAGLKEWAMVHPFDKHLIMSEDGSEMADLFNIDHNKFSNARFARITFFEQRPGDVVFTPGNAPHAVRNLEDSISLTFNFLDKATGGPKAEQFMAFTMKNKNDSTKTVPATFTFRLFSPSCRTDLRLRVPEWGSGWDLPTDEWTWRTSAGLNHLHAAAEPIRKVVPRKFAAMLKPIGATVHEWDYCIDYFFEAKSDDVLAEITKSLLNTTQQNDNHRLEQTSLCSAKWPLQRRRVNNCFEDPASPEQLQEEEDFDPAYPRRNMQRKQQESEERKFSPEIKFPQLDSHFGRFNSFPPLCSCLGYVWYFDQPSFAESFPLIKEMRKSLAENFGQPVNWHYARFPFSAENDTNNGKNWCRTQLFYSSPSIAGPVSLYPLLEDGTLLSRKPLSASSSSSTFFPHFIELTWNIDKLMKKFQDGSLCPIQILDFGLILQQKLISEVYMKLESFEEIVNSAHALGLDQFPNDAKACVDCGMEKILAVLMYLTARPGVVGFTYTHTFSAVREPDTLCLVGCAASYLMTPNVVAVQDRQQEEENNTNSSSSSLRQLLFDFCKFVKGPFDESSSTKKEEDDAEDLGTKSMGILSKVFFASGPEGEEESIEKKMERMMQYFTFINEKIFKSLHEDLELQKQTLVKVENEEDEAYVLFRKQMLRMGMLKAAVEHFQSSLGLS